MIIVGRYLIPPAPILQARLFLQRLSHKFVSVFAFQLCRGDTYVYAFTLCPLHSDRQQPPSLHNHETFGCWHGVFLLVLELDEVVIQSHES